MKININYEMWQKTNVGGVIISICLLLLFSVFFLIKNIYKIYEQRENIDFKKQQIVSAKNDTDKLEKFKKEVLKEKELFSTFKKIDWKKEFSIELINKELYKIQKQTNVEFLFINSHSIAKISHTKSKAKISLQLKVLRDYSFFSFLKNLETNMCGTVNILYFELKRDKNFNNEIVEKIKNSEKVSMFEGNIDFEIEYEQVT